MADKSLSPLTFGFDIGIASVGWCVLGEERIIDLGVRCFDKAETAKEGEPLNLARRNARLMRRRLRRRAWRLTKLVRLLKRNGVITTINALRQPATQSPWRLRVAGLERKLDADEWARVLYHLCKHRGFHWISKAEEKKAEGDAKGEGGKVKQGLAGTNKLMAEKKYRTAAEMVLLEFPEAQRNKQGDYTKALSRVLLADELSRLFVYQRDFGNPHAARKIEIAILGTGDRKSGLFWDQKPPLSGTDLLKMLGKCTFEKGEFRAPKASFTAERHVWLTRLNNLRIALDGEVRPLNDTERARVVSMPYEQAGDLTYKQVRAALTKAGLLPEHFKFSALRYPTQEGGKDPEGERLIKLPAWQELRKTLKDKGLETEWQSMAGAAIGGRPELLDQVAWVLSVFKDGEEIERELRKLSLPGGELMVQALSEVSFDKFHNLSLKALRKIVPHMEAGLRYDEACAKAGFHHSQLFNAGEGKSEYLPPLYSHRAADGRMVFREDEDIPRNPVVLRSLNQARKVLNALVRKYGSPSAVHIEMARDLTRPMDERNKIKKAQDEFRERNERDKANFETEYGMPAKSREFEKFQLYREQHGKCAYSLAALDLDRVLRDPGYAEVDHALPYSRSFDDSKNNKALVLSEENRNKGNRTPYEYLTSFPGGEEGERWRSYAAYVEGNKSYRLAKRSRLLRKDFGVKAQEEFKERNLNDTRYACRFFKNYVEHHLKFAEGSESTRCVVLSGQLTSFLRARWGLNKVRGDSDRHHAMDATVVAACSHGMVKRLSDYSRRKELKDAGSVIDMETGEIRDPVLLNQLERDFPRPWLHFREELLLRLNTDDPVTLKTGAEALGYPYEILAALKPLFVSRAPQRRNGGPLHEATLRSAKFISNGESYTRVDIRKLHLADLDRIVGASDARNTALIEVLRTRLQAHGDDGKKAFATPVFKPTFNGKAAPLIRAVKLRTTQKTGAFVGNGVADLGEMLRVDVFKKSGRYYLAPVYCFPRDKRLNPAAVPEDAEFLFSLTKNDFVEITLSGETTRGYFVMYERDGRLTLRAHDQPQPDKKYFRKSVANAGSIAKFNVDVLGSIYLAASEKRCGLA